MRKITEQRLDTSLRVWREAAETAIQEYEAYRQPLESEREFIASLVPAANASDAQQQYKQIVLDHQNRLMNALGQSQRLAGEYFHEKRGFDSQGEQP